MKKLLPLLFSGILCLTACGDEEEAAKKQATPATKEIAVEQQAEKAVVEQQDEKAEVNYTLPYSEQNFMAEFIENYLNDYTQLNVDKMDTYYSEESLRKDEQKGAIQSLIEQGITMELNYYSVETVEMVDENLYEVTTDQKYTIYDNKNNTEKEVHENVVYNVYYGYTDELLLGSIEVQ